MLPRVLFLLGSSAGFIHPQPFKSLTRACSWSSRARHHSTSTSPATTLFSSKATDGFVHIKDADGVNRKVHVLTTPPVPGYQFPPLVLVGGTAQVINSWIGQIQPLARDRQVVVYEARGQGQTELLLNDVSLARHVRDLCSILDALDLDMPVDLAGFSFGGRICMATAANRPDKVRRVVATGVSAERGALGRLIIQSWRSSLERGNFLDFAWSSILHSHGQTFLTRFESKIPSWVELVVQGNKCEGILAILNQSHVADTNDPYHTVNLARRLQCPCLLIGGEEDRLAPELEVRRLGALASPPCQVKIIPKVGHNSVFEDPKAWRDYVTNFLGQEEEYTIACRGGQPDEY